MPAVSKKAFFIEPMLLLRSDRLPEDAGAWQYELKPLSLALLLTRVCSAKSLASHFGNS
jgi:hypothetical protein